MSQQLGQVHKEADGFKVAFERVFQHPIEQVWDAITNQIKTYASRFG